MALSVDLLKLSGAVPNRQGWWAWAIAGVGGGGGGGGLFLGGGWVVGGCGQCTDTTSGFGHYLLGAVGPLDIGGVCICVGWEGPDDMVHGGGGGGAGCFSLDTSGVGTCCSIGECGLKIQGSGLVCSWGVLGKLASLSAVEVIALSADCNNLLTLVVSPSELFSSSEDLVCSSSDA
jgi:hypothetical protein